MMLRVSAGEIAILGAVTCQYPPHKCQDLQQKNLTIDVFRAIIGSMKANKMKTPNTGTTADMAEGAERLKQWSRLKT